MKKLKQDGMHIATRSLRIMRAAKEIALGHHLSRTVCNDETYRKGK